MKKIHLGIRAYLYPLIILAVCFFLHLHAKKSGAQLKQQVAPRPVKVVMPADTELQSTPNMDLPAIYLFGTKEEITFADELREALKGRCSVMQVVTSGEDVRSYFKLEKVPCAILFDKDQKELKRFDSFSSAADIIKQCNF